MKTTMRTKLAKSSKRINAWAATLALGLGGVVTPQLSDWAISNVPQLQRVPGWFAIAMTFFASTAAAFVFVGLAVRMIYLVYFVFAPLYFVLFLPHRIVQRVPTVLLRSEPDPATETPADEATQIIVDKIIRPALPGLKSALDLRLVQKSVTTPPESSIDRMTERYLAPFVLQASIQSKVIYVDPIHGQIEFDSDFGWLLNHPLVQRLNEVRQLAFAFPRYPGGTHTRFNHSLGVAHLARSAIKSVLDAGVIYTASGKESIELDEKKRARLVSLATVCGIVHDVGHPPLGHTLDRFLRARYFLGEATSDADKSFLPGVLDHLEECLTATGTSRTEVQRVLEGTDLNGWDVFLSQLLNSKLDVDRMDYLQRDAHFTGQREGLLNIHALLSAVRPFRSADNVFLAFDDAYLSDVEQFVYARDVMYLRCYEHSQKVVSEALASRCAKRFFDLYPNILSKVKQFGLLTDSQLFEVFDDSLGGDRQTQDLLRSVFQSGALSYDQVDSVPFVQGQVAGRLEGLLQDFTMESSVLPDKILEIERLTADEAGVDQQDVVLVLPDPKANEERSIGLDIRILVRTETGYDAVPLLNEKDDSSPSEVLRRRKYVASEIVSAATDLKDLRHAAEKGISLLGILRSARFRLRLFLHRRSWSSSDAVKSAFRSLGVQQT